jgi:FlaA1/EpsC-like NDP-sugar epimerase
MSITEAVYLVLCAAALGRGGETYIFDMGDPVNIYELARTVSLFSGFAPEEELPIQFTGLKKGEKVHEELWESWERRQPTAHPQIFALAGSDPLSVDMLSVVRELQCLVESHDQDGLLQLIGEIVPEFAVEQTALSA